VEDDSEELQDELAPLPTGSVSISKKLHSDSPAEQGHIVLLIDASGSMRSIDVIMREHSGQHEMVCRLEAATKCAVQFVHAHACQRPRDRFSLAMFGDGAVVEGEVLNATDMHAVLETVGARGTGGTSYMSALQVASEIIARQPMMPSHVVLLSDGRPADTKKALQLFQAQFLHGECKGTRIHGIGFGATVQSFAPLQQLACLSGGSFVLSACSIQGLAHAFSSVSSTITSSRLSDQGRGVIRHSLRPVSFEPPEISDFGKRNVLRFFATRSMFQYDGSSFHEQHFKSSQVARRLHPCMRGGMRLVYGFCDSEVVKDEGSWMVAKASRFADEACNTLAIVESHAKSTAVARYFAARFNEQLKMSVKHGHQTIAKPSTIFFVPCYIYKMAESEMSEAAEPRIFAAERFLPGAFLKYNSNNGYVCEDSMLQHQEVVQAFTHFSFVASGGRLLVADLQGVARNEETLLTDPQVLSLKSSFGPGDLCRRGMRACLAAHRCGPTCKKLGLDPVNMKLLQQLQAHTPGVATAGTPRSEGSSCWEHLSQTSAVDSWDKVSDHGLVEFAMSDGVNSNATSACSWVHVLNM
jgi:Mg-chelatase subunit ChlD